MTLSLKQAVAIQQRQIAALLHPEARAKLGQASTALAVRLATSPKSVDPSALARQQVQSAFSQLTAAQTEILVLYLLAETVSSQSLQTAENIPHENRTYSAISNIMKTKHDTVRNSINNVR